MSLFSGLGSFASAIGALAVVLGLVLLAARVARSSGLGRFGAAGLAVGRGAVGRGAVGREVGRRLAVEDAVMLDRARRLVLVRCDGRDVLLLTGGAADVVVGWLPGGGAEVGA